MKLSIPTMVGILGGTIGVLPLLAARWLTEAWAMFALIPIFPGFLILSPAMLLTRGPHSDEFALLFLLLPLANGFGYLAADPSVAAVALTEADRLLPGQRLI